MPNISSGGIDFTEDSKYNTLHVGHTNVKVKHCIDEIKESVTEKKKKSFILSSLFRIKQVCVIVVNE